MFVKIATIGSVCNWFICMAAIWLYQSRCPLRSFLCTLHRRFVPAIIALLLSVMNSFSENVCMPTVDIPGGL